MDNLTERLLDPEQFETVLKSVLTQLYENADANLATPEMKALVSTIRTLHRLLATMDKSWHEERASHLHYKEIAELYGAQRDSLATQLATAKAEGAAAREDVARLDRLEQWANETGVRIESFNSGHIRVHAGQFGLYASGISESLREACDDAARSIPSSGGGK